MGNNKSKYIKLGIFIVAGLALFVIALFYIGSKENLFTKTFNVYSIFPNVSGLTQGNSVQFAGINVGTIQSIEIIATDKVKVNMNIVSNVKKFIKKDSEASINSDGLVGNKVLAITSGSVNSPSIEDGDSVHSITPVSIGDIVKNLNESTKGAEQISKDLAEIVSKVNNGEGTLGKLINNSDVFNSLDSLMNSFSGSSANINKILAQASTTIELVTNDIRDLQGSIDTITRNVSGITTKINSSQSLVGTLLTDTVFANNIKGVLTNANQTTANLEMGSFSFYQNMEALKHNFLFKGYFEDLGYWDKTGFEKTMQTRETRILNKENELNSRESRLRDFQLKLDSLRNLLEEKKDSLK
ncbi:MAG: MlaD family protein [Ignavibacteria bacterium]|nr:MCE family protein [Ignavibacteria bacterium]MBK9405420.1 MCE family protein [Ignavibacteria bacterium]